MKPSRALVLSGGGGRGSYQAGVWTWLDEQGWKPNLISGTSVGAINGAALASGMSAVRLREFWRSIDGTEVYRRRRVRNLVQWVKNAFGTSRTLAPLYDTAPLRELLTRQLDIAAIRRSEMELVVSAVRVLDAAVRYFDGQEIGVEHIMASSAVPVVFPWEEIDGEAYWDGGLAVNTPLLPTIQRDISEVVVVLFAPITEGLAELPKTRRQAMEWTFEISSIASAEAVLSALLAVQGRAVLGETAPGKNWTTIGKTRFLAVAPDKPLGLHSLLNFHPEQTDLLIEAGYNDARRQLNGLVRP